MLTEIARIQSEEAQRVAVNSAVAMLQDGGVVALPTETVYGLGADALDPAAVEKIFEVKGRPHFDPLIVHLPFKGSYAEVAQVPDEIKKTIVQLIETFWPGPLTIVLPKKPMLPDIVTGGLPTVAVRMCKHPIFHRIIKNFGGPIAAPSANLFGKMSPTSADAVMSQLEGRIPLIVDGGACGRGLESTIIRVKAGEKKPNIEILRPGPITKEELRPFGKVTFLDRNEEVEDSNPDAPGMLANHYAPRTPLRVLSDPQDFSPEEGKRYALLSYRGKEKDGYINLHDWVDTRILSPGSGRVVEAGIRFFHMLGQLDELGVDEIISEPMPNRGVGIAICEKLRKAAIKD